MPILALVFENVPLAVVLNTVVPDGSAIKLLAASTTTVLRKPVVPAGTFVTVSGAIVYAPPDTDARSLINANIPIFVIVAVVVVLSRTSSPPNVVALKDVRTLRRLPLISAV